MKKTLEKIGVKQRLRSMLDRKKKTKKISPGPCSISARCSEALETRVRQWAEANGTDTSAFLREAVENYLDRLEQGFPRQVTRPKGPDAPKSPN